MTWTIPNILTVFRLLAAPGVALVFVLFARPTADWLALALFIGAALTDFVDGWIARAWNQQSRFGTMLDPIADKAMVIIALAVVLGVSGMDPWLVVPASAIFLREVFVSGLREFLGADAGRLAVTKLAKWKTTTQMVALAVLLAAMGIGEMHYWMYHALSAADYEAALAQGGSAVWWSANLGLVAGWIGTLCLWVAGGLTLLTGWDYFVKALPFLQEDR